MSSPSCAGRPQSTPWFQPCKTVAVCDHSFHNVTSKNLTVRWTLGHRDIRNTTTYRDYLDINGNNDSDVLANMGDNLPMDLPDPQPHDILLHGQIMATPANSWIMELRGQKQMADVHCVSRVPWLWGQVRWWGHGAP